MTEPKIIRRPTIALTGIFIFFGIIYSLISITNHYLFRTAALDLGMFNHAIYNFAHFSQNYFTLDIKGAEVNYFGDHFSPITLLYAPFYYVFGSYALLIIQIFAILFGGYGIYKYSLINSIRTYIPFIILIQFYSIWGIYSALSFDFHNNVVAAMFLPWLVYNYEKNNPRGFLIFFILMLISKENIALWLVFITVGLALGRMFNERNFAIKDYLKFEIPLVTFSLIYFFIVVGYVMPYLRDFEGFNQLSRYNHLGGSIFEIVSYMVSHPKYIFSLLFENYSGNELYTGIKSELHFMVLISGGYVLFYQPKFLIMLIPIYAQKLLSSNYGLWGINVQYSIEIAPILSLGLIGFLRNIKSDRIAYTLAILTTVLTIFYTYRTIETRKSKWYNKTNTIFYDRLHYQTPLNVNEIKNQLKTIPEDAIVSASSSLSAHLSFRKKIYLFPIVKDADYIVLLTANSSTYPLNQEAFKSKISEYLNSDTYEKQYAKNDLLILKRIK